jgi:hypothetical protein
MTSDPKIARIGASADAVPPSDLDEIERLWTNPQHAQTLTGRSIHTIPVKRPSTTTFIRVHPEPSYQRSGSVIVDEEEGGFDRTLYLLLPGLEQHLPFDVKPFTLCLAIDRASGLYIWPIRDPKTGEKDNSHWASERQCALHAMRFWCRVVSTRNGKQTVDAPLDYAPDPDWSRVPPFNQLIKTAFGETGIIREINHPVLLKLLGKKQRGDI